MEYLAAMPTRTLVPGVIALCLAGCASSHTDPGAAADRGLDLDVTYVVGPTAARELGYRILYQATVPIQHDAGLKRVAVRGESMYVLDGDNFLTRLRHRDGEQIWRVPVAAPYNEVQGIDYIPGYGRVLVTVGGDLYELDDDTGSLIAKQDLGPIASTDPVVYGGLLIYGARNGQIVWHSWEVGHTWKAYQVSPAMRVAPLLLDDLIFAAGSDGRVMVIHAPSATGVWDKKLLNGVEAQPVAAGDIVYIAGLDQYLWAIDVHTGRTHWKHLAETPLRTPPAVIDDSVYQYIPNEGLVCFEARPDDMPGGNIRWTARGVRGDVLGRDGERLIVWDEPSRTVTLVSTGRGAVIETVRLPSVASLQATELIGGDLVAAGDDGRVSRLVPKGRS